MMGDSVRPVWFAVLRGLDGREQPALYHDMSPYGLLAKGDTRLRYCLRLDTLPGRLERWPLAKLWEAYQKRKAAGTLPPQDR